MRRVGLTHHYARLSRNDEQLDAWIRARNAERQAARERGRTAKIPPSWVSLTEGEAMNESVLMEIGAVEEEIGKLRAALKLFVNNSECKKNHAKSISEMFAISCPHCQGEAALKTDRAALTRRVRDLLEELAMERRERNLVELRCRAALKVIEDSRVAPSGG